MDQITLREFDHLSVPPASTHKADEIKLIREDTRVSQAVFARMLNISVSTVHE
ncbi:putative transcriptional regulator [Thioalkalivibrio sulfidiphilus HL-EbGr7]|uniref:Putative transcriptional regulator n=1 Tax=Thioalkalivibrio sulfidiphilus (strain HL-EbGR7) TaxID=396588 RepID=B8GPG5_THISH|nr:transcriptional regulator [Thioalkalivibrio sulfidiphilus]ACL72132.1 putative transcriptional regulator [Thioalkalivibrio sulfidiphilus HL-EbGr7]